MMISNVVLQSQDRELFGVIIQQETKNGFLSLTALQEAYEKARWQNGWYAKDLNTLMRTRDFKERVYHLLYERDIIKTSFDGFMDMIDTEGFIKVLKGLGVWKTTGKGAAKGVSVDPYVWVLIAMELNPMIYAKVVIWLTDSLIFDRLEAGGETKPLNRALCKVLNGNIQKDSYPKMYNAINTRVYGEPKSGMRNLASSAQLKMIADIEKFISSAVDMGWLKTEEDMLNAIKNYTKM